MRSPPQSDRVQEISWICISHIFISNTASRQVCFSFPGKLCHDNLIQLVIVIEWSMGGIPLYRLQLRPAIYWPIGLNCSLVKCRCSPSPSWSVACHGLLTVVCCSCEHSHLITQKLSIQTVPYNIQQHDISNFLIFENKEENAKRSVDLFSISKTRSDVFIWFVDHIHCRIDSIVLLPTCPDTCRKVWRYLFHINNRLI